MTRFTQSLLDDENAIIRRRPLQDDARFDITAMIDLVFMMNIFFLVTTVGAAMAEIDLPAARHVVAADRDSSIIFTLVATGTGGRTLLHIGDGRVGKALLDPEAQKQAVRAAVEAGIREQKQSVLVKAEKQVPLRDVVRIAQAATSVAQTELKLAVMEKE